MNLADLRDWQVGGDSIYRCDNNYFSIIGSQITIMGREVNSWYQPLALPANEGHIILVGYKTDGEFHFLVNTKYECGTPHGYEYGPTIHTTNLVDDPLYKMLSVDDVIEECLLDVLWSEEGGRFLHDSNRNRIVILPKEHKIFHESGLQLVSANALRTLCRSSNTVNIQLRSIFSRVQYEY